MGQARTRSWSHTRGNLAESCRRALYFQYYSTGDEVERMARILKRAVTPASLAGTIIHRYMAAGLRQFARQGAYPEWLHRDGVRAYDDALAGSRVGAEAIRSGMSAPPNLPVLLHHLEGNEDPVGEERGHRTVERCLRTFESSSMLAFLRLTDPRRWERVLEEDDRIPSFYATREMGFDSAVGLRIYGAYDLALRWGDDLLIVDWKSGKRSPRAEASAHRQLAVYSLWAMSQGWRIDRIRLMAFWLGEEGQWEPTAPDEATITSVMGTIEAHDAIERDAVRLVADEDGQIIRYEADPEAFPPTPDPRRCGYCPFRSICPEGQATVPKGTARGE